MTDAAQQPRLLTPSKITAWLDCAHYLTLQHEVEAGTLEADAARSASSPSCCWTRASSTSRRAWRTTEAEGTTVHVVPERDKARDVRSIGSTGSATCWPTATTSSTRCRSCTTASAASPTSWCGSTTPTTGTFTYEPVDAKLARARPSPATCCSCASTPTPSRPPTGVAPEHVHIWLGSGAVETDPPRRRARRTGAGCAASCARCSIGADADAPPPCRSRATTAQFCEFAEHCEQQWRDADSLSTSPASARADDRDARSRAASPRWPRWRPLDDRSPTCEPERLSTPRSPGRAAGAGRATMPDEPPPFELHRRRRPTPTSWAHGFERCPSPTTATCSSTSRAIRSGVPTPGCSSCSACSPSDAERRVEVRGVVGARPRTRKARRRQALIDYLADRRAQYPGHARVPLQPHRAIGARAAGRRARRRRGRCCEQLVETGLFVDLLPWSRNALQVGTESLRPEAHRAADRLRARPRHRPGRRRGRRVRART